MAEGIPMFNRQIPGARVDTPRTMSFFLDREYGGDGARYIWEIPGTEINGDVIVDSDKRLDFDFVEERALRLYESAIHN